MNKTVFIAVFSMIAALFAAAPAHAQGETTFKDIMQDIGLQKRKEEKMDFSERAPLVLPPSTEMLPPPEASGALATVNPNWPNDPEVAKALEDAEKEKIPQHLRRKYREDAGRDIYDIQRKEREARQQGEVSEPAKAYDTTFDRNTVLTPEQLKEVKEKREAAPQASVYVEPERKRLTDPPAGYRTPSAAQPYGPAGKEKKAGGSWWNPFD